MILTKQDWIQIRRESNWYNELRTHTFSKFLETDAKKVLSTAKTFDGAYNKYTIAVCFEEFLKENGYKQIDHLGIERNDYVPLQKEDIEISPGVFKRCITEGLVLLQKGNHKCILEFEESYGGIDKWSVMLYYKHSEETQTLKFLTDLVAYSDIHNYLKKAKIDPSLEHLNLATKYTWNDVILPGKVKEELQTNIDSLFKNIEIYKNAGLTFKRGIILKGVPGTGKTLIGKVLCQTCDCSFIWVTSKYLSRADHIATVCTLARALAPTILFLEDIDLYGEHRSVSRDKSVLGELMNQLDGLIENEFIVVVATTNDIEHVETALQNRPGRFDRIVDVSLPDFDCRVKLLELHTKKHILKDVDLKKIAKITDGFTGAHVKELITAAVITAIDEKSIDVCKKVVLLKDHFRKNINDVKDKKMKPNMGFSTKTDNNDPPEYEDKDYDL